MHHHHTTLSRRTVLSLIAAGTAVLARPSLAHSTTIHVWKNTGCGCCGAWVEYIRRSGFAPVVTDTPNMHAIKAQFAVPGALASCHTARIGDYVIEGHVPAAAIIQLIAIAERSAGLGLAVPGMSTGSPGMEAASPETYDVILFGRGTQKRYARFNGSRRI